MRKLDICRIIGTKTTKTWGIKFMASTPKPVRKKQKKEQMKMFSEFKKSVPAHKRSHKSETEMTTPEVKKQTKRLAKKDFPAHRISRKGK